MHKKDMYLLIGNVLMLTGFAGIPVLYDHGYITNPSLAISASSAALLVSFCLWFMGIMAESERADEPVKG